MIKRQHKVATSSAKNNHLKLPVVGTLEWKSWLNTLATRLGRELKRQEIKYLAAVSHKIHGDRLRKGHLVQRNVFKKNV